ncbi:MAG: lysine--tRNA ligase [Thiotrichaceae bacterium]|nr:lysine--tRNA ligase [Thiotrichaceae bacterium]
MSNKANNPEASSNENQLVTQRREKLENIRATQKTAFPNDFKRRDYAAPVKMTYGEHDREWFEHNIVQISIAGRVMLKRVMGKASFITISDTTGRMQIFVKGDNVGAEVYADFKTWDSGDIVGIEGELFKTKTGELSIRASSIRLLTKSLRPLPEKFHGLTDHEQRYRQRYLDLIMNDDARAVFMVRSMIVTYIRNYFQQRDFLEVETPMLQAIPGGATARPFVTHHNALGMDMYLRIAPELYLKRLVVGGFDRVFEINRNFRNEGVSTRHNPEFTMLEWYQAYATYHDLMDTTEELLKGIARDCIGNTTITYQEDVYDFTKPFERITVKQSILDYNEAISGEDLDDFDKVVSIAEGLGIKVESYWGLGKLQMEIFDKTVEHQLIQPTFITAYPAEVSPLARRNDDDHFVTDRFEFFIGGREIGNGFSELNDAEDQAERFKQQVAEKDAGDNEAMHYDDDYIRALEYGMPPTAGEGIGIDRLVMLFTDAPSIRDVILFPHMRRE